MLSKHMNQNACRFGQAAACSSSSGFTCSRPVCSTSLQAYKPERQGYTPIPFKQQPPPPPPSYVPPQPQQTPPQQQQQWTEADQWQQQQPRPQQQQRSIRWQQQQQAASSAAAWQQDSQADQQQQPRQRRRQRSPLLEQRQAWEQQQEQQQQQQQQQGSWGSAGQRRSCSSSSSEASEDGSWFVEQPLGTWTQQAPAMWQQQQQQQQMSEEDWQEEQLLEDQLQEWLDQGDGGQGLPLKLVSKQFGSGKTAAWFHERRYLQPSALHKEITARSGRGQLEVAALTHLVRTASTAREAALALAAVSAVRHVAIAQGRVMPWPDSFLKAFIKMTTICDSHEVLVSAMQRPNELGFVFKHKSLNIALKHWGNKLELHKLEQIMLVAETAGLPPDARMAYALVRACVNAQQWEKLDEVLEWFRGQGVTRYKPAMEKLLALAATQRAAAVVAVDEEQQ